MERVASSHNSAEQARAAAAGTRGGGGTLGAESLALLEQRIEARLGVMSSQYVSAETLREWEIRCVPEWRR